MFYILTWLYPYDILGYNALKMKNITFYILGASSGKHDFGGGMKVKKKFVVLLVVMFMVSCLGLVGCSKDEATTAPSSQSDQQKSGDTSKSNVDNELAKLMKSAHEVPGMSYEMVSTITSEGQTMTSTSKMWMSKEKMRMETETNGMKSIMITNAKGEFFMYDEASNTAMKMSDTEDQDQFADQWAEDESDLDNMKIVGQEKLDGYNCVVVSVTDMENDTKMWLRKDIGMPVKVESKMEDGSMVIEYKNYKIGAQADSLFQVPAGAQIMDMPSIPDMPGQ